ncbi:MAG: hypothetical protein U0Q15_09665 [Kineosporiaceae bacterium]
MTARVRRLLGAAAPAPRLIDTTLREGAQAPVPYLDPARVRALVAALGRVGVEELELGHVVADPALRGGPSADLPQLVADAARLAPGARRAVWCRALPEDVLAAAAMAPDVVSFAVPVSDAHLKVRLRRDRPWALDAVARLTRLARAHGVPYVSVGLEDATRADPRFVAQVARAAGRAGADRVRIADTVGVAGPLRLAALVRTVRRRFDGEVAVHVHDDLGMATASSVAALEAGACWADSSVLGLGERAGIARTEEVAAWLVLAAGAGYDLRRLRHACHDLAGWVQRPVPEAAPVIGERVFACESGIHLDGLAKDPSLYEPFPPELVGARREWRLGRTAGRGAVRALLGPGEEAAAWRAAAVRRGRSLDVELAPRERGVG